MPKKANIFESFSHSAIQQFKEAFGIMDTDKDGLLSASDLVAAFGAHGKSIGSGDAQVGDQCHGGGGRDVEMFTRRDNECPRVPCVPGCTVGMCGQTQGKQSHLAAGGGRPQGHFTGCNTNTFPLFPPSRLFLSLSSSACTHFSQCGVTHLQLSC